MRRGVGQGNLVESLIGPKAGRSVTLDWITALLDWPGLEAVLGEVYAAPTGRPSYPIGLLLRALLLQGWHGLSNPAAELALADRLSFRRSSVWAWTNQRPTIRRCGASARNWHGAVWTRRYSTRWSGNWTGGGAILRTGTLIDASLIEANVSARNERQDGTPVDPDARWAKRRNGRSVQGYKLHASEDAGSGLVRGLVVKDAATHDVREGPGLVQGDEARATADKAYDSGAMLAAAAAAGTRTG